MELRDWLGPGNIFQNDGVLCVPFSFLAHFEVISTSPQISILGLRQILRVHPHTFVQAGPARSPHVPEQRLGPRSSNDFALIRLSILNLPSWERPAGVDPLDGTLDIAPCEGCGVGENALPVNAGMDESRDMKTRVILDVDEEV